MKKFLSKKIFGSSYLEDRARYKQSVIAELKRPCSYIKSPILKEIPAKITTL